MFDDGFPYFALPMSRIGHNGAGTEINPAVSHHVAHLILIGMVPDDRRLEAVDLGEQSSTFAEDRESLWSRKASTNATVVRVDGVALFWIP